MYVHIQLYSVYVTEYICVYVCVCVHLYMLYLLQKASPIMTAATMTPVTKRRSTMTTPTVTPVLSGAAGTGWGETKKKHSMIIETAAFQLGHGCAFRSAETHHISMVLSTLICSAASGVQECLCK